MVELDETWVEVRIRLKSYVRTKVNVDVSEDLVHDILLKLLQNKSKLSEVDNLFAWVYTIAKNSIADYYRKQSNINTTSHLEHLAMESADSERLPEIWPDNPDHDFAECLRPLIEKLEPKYKEALLLTDIKEMKQAAAAEQVGMSLSGMKSRVQRARVKLKEALLACCVIEVDRFGKVINYKQKDSSDQSCCY